jgi:hypothetical protein
MIFSYRIQICLAFPDNILKLTSTIVQDNILVFPCLVENNSMKSRYPRKHLDSH